MLREKCQNCRHMYPTLLEAYDCFDRFCPVVRTGLFTNADLERLEEWARVSRKHSDQLRDKWNWEDKKLLEKIQDLEEELS